MSEVAFHSGVADKIGYTCRLLRKAWRQDARVIVTGDAADMARLDPMLWTFDTSEFIPHVRVRVGAAVAAELARTPIWLVDAGASAPESALAVAQVLINLGPGPADGATRVERVIEIVSPNPEDVQAGRRRWRDYERAGITPSHPAQGSSET